MGAWAPIPERLERLSIPEPNSGCWLWLGSLDRCGYGKFGAGKETLAHRASYVAFVGPIKAGTEIDHVCCNRGCINPTHLRAISHAANIARADYTTNHRNRVKTHCMHGHELSGDNVRIEMWRGNAARKCRTCTTAKNLRSAAKRKLMKTNYGIVVLET